MKRSILFESMMIFLLPTLIIITQWISISGIRLSWVISLLMIIPILKKSRIIIKRWLLVLISGSVIIWPLLSNIWSYASEFNVSLYISLITGLVCMLFITQLDTNSFNILLYGAAFSTVLFAIWGVFESYTGIYILYEHDFFTERLNQYGNNYPCVAFTNTNDLAQYLVMIFSISAGKILEQSKLAFVGVLGVIILVIYNSQSRLSMMCLLFFLVIGFVLVLIKEKKKSGMFLLFSLIVLSIVGLVIVEIKTGVVTNLIKNYLIIEGDADYTTGRSEIYMNVLKAAVHLPVGGFGTSYVVNATFPPHNFFLYILCDFGWIPAILFVMLLINYFIVLWKKYLYGSMSVQIIALIASTSIFPIMSCVSSANEQRKVIWLYLGIVIKIYLDLKAHHSQVEDKNFAKKNKNTFGYRKFS